MFDHPAPRAALPCLLACALLGAHSTSASADTALSLGSSTVIANPSSGSLPTSSVISSVDLLGSDILEQQPVLYSWELFRRAPG